MNIIHLFYFLRLAIRMYMLIIPGSRLLQAYRPTHVKIRFWIPFKTVHKAGKLQTKKAYI